MDKIILHTVVLPNDKSKCSKPADSVNFYQHEFLYMSDHMSTWICFVNYMNVSSLGNLVASWNSKITLTWLISTARYHWFSNEILILQEENISR